MNKSWGDITGNLMSKKIAVSNLLLAVYPEILESKLGKIDKTSEVFMTHFKKETYRIVQLEALTIIILHALIIYFFKIPILSYLIVYYGFALFWSSLQYIHHYEAERDIIDGANNLYFFKLIDKIWLNHNLHKTHHQKPTAPWIYLPKIAKEKNEKSTSIVPAYFKMWKGPKPAETRFQGEFKGNVSRH